jgi:hypothetical protein
LKSWDISSRGGDYDLAVTRRLRAPERAYQGQSVYGLDNAWIAATTSSRICRDSRWTFDEPLELMSSESTRWVSWLMRDMPTSQLLVVVNRNTDLTVADAEHTHSVMSGERTTISFTYSSDGIICSHAKLGIGIRHPCHGHVNSHRLNPNHKRNIAWAILTLALTKRTKEDSNCWPRLVLGMHPVGQVEYCRLCNRQGNCRSSILANFACSIERHEAHLQGRGFTLFTRPRTISMPRRHRRHCCSAERLTLARHLPKYMGFSIDVSFIEAFLDVSPNEKRRRRDEWEHK